MNSISNLTSFFGWLTIVNIGIYIIVAISITTFRNLMVSMNTRIFNITESDIMRESFRYVAHYKLLITVLCFAPYLTLKIMAA